MVNLVKRFSDSYLGVEVGFDIAENRPFIFSSKEGWSRDEYNLTGDEKISNLALEQVDQQYALKWDEEFEPSCAF